MPDPEIYRNAFNIEEEAGKYAERLMHLTKLSRERTLYIGGFGMPSFMGGYTRWGYVSYLSSLYMYSEHMNRFFALAGEQARLRNEAIAHAVKTYDIVPVVYGGDDICFNEGPICSVSLLDEMYFPALKQAIEPLTDAGIDIVWHCDGNILPIAERLISHGITGFQGFQEREANIPIERCFRLAAPGGGFCLAPTSSVLPETPLENIITFTEYGQKFGRRFLREMWSV